jgi:hypothetical protein
MKTLSCIERYACVGSQLWRRYWLFSPWADAPRTNVLGAAGKVRVAVMAGLVPAIYALAGAKDVDARVKPRVKPRVKLAHDADINEVGAKRR